ncbi:hypothetical protein MVEG_05189 [Podila verticillata NRRL 6337]|nr:MAG: hypothetical protein BYD32DRAFT_422313 [Podila humilis]KFH68371.1 hypothetical protein MVEG_05189 [Podila verticillata NRRL 6337]
MTDPNRQSITGTSGLDTRARLDAKLEQETHGRGAGPTVHGIPPFTVPRADGTLEASIDIDNDASGGATGRMRRRQGDVARGDHDGDGNQTNLQGYRDSGSSDDDVWGRQFKGSGISGPSGSTSRRPLLQRLRKAFLPVLIGGLVGWYFDAVDVLVYRNDPRIKGNLLTFSLLCLSTMMSIFFYLEFIRPLVLKRPTIYVNWEKEMLYPVRVATSSLVMGLIGANVALWPVWHLSTMFVLFAVAVAAVNVLGIFF